MFGVFVRLMVRDREAELMAGVGLDTSDAYRVRRLLEPQKLWVEQ